MPDNKEISALTTAEQTSNNDLFETSIPNAMTDTGYISRKQSVTMLEQQMLGNTQYNTELPNFTAGNRTIFKALEEARSSGGGGASVIQKTMAEYTALPSADKMNGSIYKITDKALIYCLDEEYHAVLEITSADYAQLTSAEKNNGTLYVLTDEETTADDIPYTSGVSVADKIDDLSYIENTSVDSVTGVTWTYKKYNNGDLEVWGHKNYTPSASISFIAWGSIYSTSFDVGTYPIAFYAPPTVIGQVQIENVGSVSSIQAASSTTVAPQIACVRGTAGTIETTFHINLSLYARGRWKA